MNSENIFNYPADFSLSHANAPANQRSTGSSVRKALIFLSCLLSLSLPSINLGASCADTPNKKSEKTEKNEKNEKEADKKDEKTAAKKEEPAAKTPEPVIENVVNVVPEDLVNKPHEYLGKNVKFTAPFFAFSNLALDYKPAYRSSKTHISLLVSASKKKLPLSELKLAMMTPKEKDPETQLLATLKEGDSVEITGKVFSTALDDPWVEILRLKKIGGSKDDDKKADASSKTKSNDTKSNDAKTDAKSDKSGSGKSENSPKSPH
jgi:hypothetical protein